MYFNSHAPWGAWLCICIITCRKENFNSHAPWGAWQGVDEVTIVEFDISTHTLRGERDQSGQPVRKTMDDFNSHAPWGAWRSVAIVLNISFNFNSHAPWGAWQHNSNGALYIRFISTHTLRGERDHVPSLPFAFLVSFQLTRSVGSVTRYISAKSWWCQFQLTRSVGSVT